MDNNELRNSISKAKAENYSTLDLSNKQLSKIPLEIGQLDNLKELSLSFNNLSSLPLEMGKLIKLEKLELESFLKPTYELIGIPNCITELENLQSLNLKSNRLDWEKPNNLNNLRKLVNLNLSKNNLKSLPLELCDIPTLQHLDLSDNKIVMLPIEITKLKNLEFLDLRGNIIPIPPEILEKTDEPRTIINYMAEVYDDFRRELVTLQQKVSELNAIPEEQALPIKPAKRINQIKLLIVGQGSVGKTSLVQQILHGTFNHNQAKTEGISINQWQIEGSQEARIENRETSDSQFPNNDSQIRLNIWDFGGQEIMHATHQFFLTKRSLYLLVLDARLTQEENRVEYWLKIIQSFGGESPVLIVGNKTDQHRLDIDRTGLQKKYPNIVGILETSAETGAGIEALKTEIAKQVDTLPHVRDLLPETWFTVKSKLEELAKNKNFFTQDEYLSLCDTNDVRDETSQHTLIGFLHDLGVVLHFQDDPRLEALGILNPQWVTNGVYKILNSHELFQSQGILNPRLLNEILNNPEYPRDKRLFIVDMMKKFELCYDVISDKSFLIPDLLPKDEPYTGEWNSALAFQYHYNVLPSSIITRFIVRMNAFIHKTVWRSGVVLKSGGNAALVKADTEDRKVYVWVNGDENTRRDFLSAILMEFDAIHKTIAKIEATEIVPHPKHPNLILDYDELIEFERQGVTEFPRKVGAQIIKCDVRELLNGIRPPKTQAVKVFISYAHKDKSFAKKLSGELESQDMKVWWDFDSLKGGQDWQKEIERGIKQSDFFLVALTPDAIASEWVGNEITYANQAQKTIIPLHLKKCDMPISLIKKQYIDFEKQSQKLAIKELLVLLKRARA